MMKVSDNFLAEQLLIIVSSTFSNTLSSLKVINFILENQLKDLKQKPRWADDSGISRYKLCTPNSFVDVLTKMYRKIPKERLFSFFPDRRKSCSLIKGLSGKENSYIYAKSGTLGSNYNLSGNLIADSGKFLRFSYIYNNFMHSNIEIKAHIQTVFEQLRDDL